VKLVLVSSNGRKSDFERLNNKINASPKKKLIVLKRDLPYDELVSLYQNSLALLIPIRPITEDTARFPHKLGEYTASKSLIITTNFGEVRNYFKDLENALISKNYSIEEYSAKIDYAIKQKFFLKEIKENSFETGRLNFDYKISGIKIYNFLYKNQS
jgi:glycosyltransferase involved in cell wall biosynthesis